MKRILLLIPSFLFISFLAAGQDEVLVWSDEFDVDGAPNPASWNYDAGNGQGGWGNNEVENYTSKSANVRVAGGFLFIDALKNNGTWTSARIKTQSKINLTYGRIQFRAQLPTGSGTWPALWLLGSSVDTKGWPACGEIDVLEHVGKNPGVVQSAIHTPSSFGNTSNKGTTKVSSFATAFHTYELNWTPTKLEFSVDGKVAYYTYQPSARNPSTWPFDNSCFLIVNLAMGGNLGSDPQYESGGLRNGIDPDLTSAELQLDYIRVYQSIGNLNITGPAIVAKNQANLKYKFTSLPGATYAWTVPSDAQITAGAGTNQITVAWGQTEGDVSLQVTTGGNSYTKTLPVTQVVKPQGAVFPLRSETFNVMWANNTTNVNQYPIISQSPLRTNYTVSAKYTAPALIGTFSRGIDLTEYPILRVKAKTFNKSKTVNLRMDLIDINGNATNAAPVFDFLPLIDDGEYYKYAFDFGALNQWKSATGNVTNNAIDQINLYIDYGPTGAIGSDSVWVDSLWVEQTPSGITVPNRPSGITAVNGSGFALSWNDNSDNEAGFKIYRATTAAGTYSEIASAAADATTASISGTTESPSRFFYRVRAFNGVGLSDYSNTLSPADIVTGIAENKSNTRILFYPNPTTGKVKIQLENNASAAIRVSSLLGTEVIRLHSDGGDVILDLSPFSSGVYLLEVTSANQRRMEKVILL